MTVVRGSRPPGVDQREILFTNGVRACLQKTDTVTCVGSKQWQRCCGEC